MRITTHVSYLPKINAPVASYSPTAKFAGGISAWSEQEDDKLRSMWLEGLTSSEIATFMPRRNRNSIIGRAHRLGLPARPSPIRR